LIVALAGELVRSVLITYLRIEIGRCFVFWSSFHGCLLCVLVSGTATWEDLEAYLRRELGFRCLTIERFTRILQWRNNLKRYGAAERLRAEHFGCK